MSDPTENTPPSQPSATPQPAAAPAYQAQPAPVYGAPAASGQPAYGQQQPGPATFNVLSIVAFVSAFIVFPVAIVCGHISLSQIKKTGEKGRGFAIAALVLGYVSLVFLILGIILFFVVLGIMAADPSFAPYSN